MRTYAPGENPLRLVPVARHRVTRHRRQSRARGDNRPSLLQPDRRLGNPNNFIKIYVCLIVSPSRIKQIARLKPMASGRSIGTDRSINRHSKTLANRERNNREPVAPGKNLFTIRRKN
jgi:hypothetical protein